MRKSFEGAAGGMGSAGLRAGEARLLERSIIMLHVRAARPEAFSCVAKTPDGAKRQVPAGAAQNRYAVYAWRGLRKREARAGVDCGLSKVCYGHFCARTRCVR